MADGTRIEWTQGPDGTPGATWNPVTGCSVVSPGCTNCYAMRLAGTRLRHLQSRAGLTRATKAGPVWTGEVRLNEQWLDQPLRWLRPRRIFVCAHGDLFHEGVPDEWIDRVFAVMALAPQHKFIVLTKRAARMREYIERKGREDSYGALSDAVLATSMQHGVSCDQRLAVWPLPNVWLGVSVEDQARADERIPHLLATPAAVRLISAEPFLGPIDLPHIIHENGRGEHYYHALDGYVIDGSQSQTNRLDWVIVGGESGPNARPMLRQWARSLRDQCAAAGVPFFFKQCGEWIDADELLDQIEAGPGSIARDGQPWRPDRPLNYADAARLAQICGIHAIAHHSDGTTMLRAGKARAGRMLDGREHNEMPR